MGPTDRGRRRLREPEVPDLPRLDELLHGPNGLLDGHLRVHPVLVVEVYVVHPKPRKGGVAGLTHVLGFAIHPNPAAVLAPLIAELGG